MTHAEALSGSRPAGMPESSCQIEIVLLDSYPDYIVVNGAIVPRTVKVYRCVWCEARIVLDEGGVRNVYRVKEIGVSG